MHFSEHISIDKWCTMVQALVRGSSGSEITAGQGWGRGRNFCYHYFTAKDTEADQPVSKVTRDILQNQMQIGFRNACLGTVVELGIGGTTSVWDPGSHVGCCMWKELNLSDVNLFWIWSLLYVRSTMIDFLPWFLGLCWLSVVDETEGSPCCTELHGVDLYLVSMQDAGMVQRAQFWGLMPGLGHLLSHSLTYKHGQLSLQRAVPSLQSGTCPNPFCMVVKSTWDYAVGRNTESASYILTPCAASVYGT